MPRQRRRRRGPVQYQGPRRTKPPFPINLIFNIKFFYFFFIVVMIASMGAIGLGTTSGGSGRPAEVEEEVEPEETPSALTFDSWQPTIDTTKPYKAVLQTNKGDITIELATTAPNSVNSFAYLAGKGFYDGQVFFYVDQQYFAQAGDPTCKAAAETACSGVGGPGYTLQVEDSGLTHEQWAVASLTMASGGQEMHGSQFRILFEADQRLDGQETVFGKVVGGTEILEALPNLLPCSVVSSDPCDRDLSSALVIEKVMVVPA